jgi:adenine-specific DNA-methyltransferase
MEVPGLRADLVLPLEVMIEGKSVHYGGGYRCGYDVLLACNDVLDFLEQVPKNKATLIITSPHYNLGKVYEERMEFGHYLKWQKKVIERCVDFLRPDGNICWQVGNHLKNGEVFPLDVFFYRIFKDLGLKLRNRIIWHFGHGLHARRRFSGRYETILWFTKSDDYIFNLDPVRVPQKYPGKRAYKGPNKGKPTCNPLGKNPSDIWITLKKDWKREVWEIPNVKHNHPEKTFHPSQFPIELVERLVLALTNENDTVFDPFVGVGSSVIAAVLHRRKGIGIDKKKAYTDLAFQRVCKALKGELRRRLLGTPIYKPRGTERVARIPLEWKKETCEVREEATS